MSANPPDSGSAASPETAEVSQEDRDTLAAADATEAPETTTEASVLDADILKKLESIDPTKLPEAFRRKLESPFTSDYTKKTQALAEERRRLDEDRQQDRKMLLSLVDRITGKNGQDLAPDRKAELIEKIRDGDTSLIDQLVDMSVQEKVAPKLAVISQREALDEAARIFPALPKYEQQVADALRADPELLRLSVMDNHRYAGKVLAALGIQIHNRQLEQEFETYKAGEAERVKQAINDWKTRVRGLPTNTSHSGTTSATEGKKVATSFREAANEAWDEELRKKSTR